MFQHFISKNEKDVIQNFEIKNSEDDVDYNAKTMLFRRRYQNHMPWQIILAEGTQNGEPADFLNEQTKKEYSVSGLCHFCQQTLFDVCL